jgi:hypothetical protein
MQAADSIIFALPATTATAMVPRISRIIPIQQPHITITVVESKSI